MGELGLIVVYAALALFSLLVASKAWTPEYAFHAVLFALGSIAAIVGVFKRYGARSAEWPAQEIDGKPNYNYGPIKFMATISLVWGVAGFLVWQLFAVVAMFAWKRRR